MKTKTKNKENAKDSQSSKPSQLRLIEKRKHPRFFLTNEQFRDKKTGKIYPVYDLSVTGLSIKIEEQSWKEGSSLTGTLNLHPDSIDISPRLVAYYEDRAALKFEALTTYSKEVLNRVLSPKRLGLSLKVIKEKLPHLDYWFHGVCNTDLLIKLGESGRVERAEVFFSSFYFGYQFNQVEKQISEKQTTGHCYSFGLEKREELFLSMNPVKMETVEIEHDLEVDQKTVDFAKKIVESANIENRLKEKLIPLFNLLNSKENLSGS